MPVEAADTIYVADSSNKSIDIARPGSPPVLFVDGLTSVNGLAADGQGNLYVAGEIDNSIRQVTPAGQVSIYFNSIRLGSPSAMTFDTAGNLYTTGWGWGGIINKVSTDRTMTQYASSGGYGMAFDSHGNIYVAGVWDHIVERITPGGAVNVLATDFQAGRGVAVDKNDNVFVADQSAGTISKITPGGSISLFATGLNRPTGIEFDSSGNLFVCTSQGSVGTLCEVSPTGSVSVYATGFGLITDVVIVPVPEPSLICPGCILGGLWLIRRKFPRAD